MYFKVNFFFYLQYLIIYVLVYIFFCFDHTGMIATIKDTQQLDPLTHMIINKGPQVTIYICIQHVNARK